jgi:hypothetical protein
MGIFLRNALKKNSSKTYKQYTPIYMHSSLSIYILIFFSETIELIGTKLVRNGHWMVSYKVFFVDQKYTKETRGPKISKRVCAFVVCLLFLLNSYM